MNDEGWIFWNRRSVPHSSHSFPMSFNIETTKGPRRSFVVLDKSFLQGVSPAQLQYYVQQGWVFGIADVFWYEHFRKWDEWRLANLVKLKSVEKNLVQLPGIGEIVSSKITETQAGVTSSRLFGAAPLTAKSK